MKYYLPPSGYYILITFHSITIPPLQLTVSPFTHLDPSEASHATVSAISSISPNLLSAVVISLAFALVGESGASGVTVGPTRTPFTVKWCLIASSFAQVRVRESRAALEAA
jgi:hypothetical protein